MTRDVLETAAREGVPFVIKMADGEKYRVNARGRIIVSILVLSLWRTKISRTCSRC
jgi:hypothetical protein